MDEFTLAKQAGARIFRAGIEYIQTHGWSHNSMGILLSASGDNPWPQPMAVLMFSELSNQLKGKTLTQFDQKTHSKDDVIKLFERVAGALENS